MDNSSSSMVQLSKIMFIESNPSINSSNFDFIPFWSLFSSFRMIPHHNLDNTNQKSKENN